MTAIKNLAYYRHIQNGLAWIFDAENGLQGVHMGYIDKNLLPGEEIVFRTKRSLIIFLLPAAWTVFAFYAVPYMQTNPILAKLDWAPWLIAFLWWAYYGIEYLSSDFVVSNRRVMMREGFFNRHSAELRIATISQVNVDQSLFGQLLNYGILSLNAFGAFDVYPQVSNPYAFQRAINEQLDGSTR